MTKEDISSFVKDLKGKKDVTLMEKGAKNNAPKPLSYKDSRKSFTPDVVAVYPKRQDFYVFEKKITAKSLPEMIGKWILFALHARLKSGKFFLVVAGENERRRCQAIIDRKQLAVELIVL